jgi:predicted MFS family arabinose efflux permease
LLVSILGVSVSASVVPIYAIGAFVKPLQSSFGWSRGAIAYALTPYFVGAIVAAVICGWLLRHFDVRRVAIGSLFGNALGFMLLSCVNGSIWSLYAGMFALIILGAGTLSATWTLVTNYRFVRNRGLALAIILSGSGLASTFAPAYATGLIRAYGWRVAFVGLGLPSLLLALPAVLLFLPRQLQAPASRAHSSAAAISPATGLTLGQALKSWRLWRLGIGLMLVVMGIFGLIPNLIPLLTDSGLSSPRAAALAGMIGGSLTLSRLGSGFLIDRLWAPGVAAVLLVTPALTCIILLLGLHSTAALTLAVIFIGVGTGAENDIAAYLTARYFGLKDYGSVFSAVTIVITAGNIVSPLLFGSLYDSTKSYSGVLRVSAGLFVAGAGLLLTLGRYPRWQPTTQAAEV